MWDWFRQARDKPIPLSGPILQSKALEFASQLAIADFKASNGWLEKVKARHTIKAFAISGESAGVDLQTVDGFRSRIPEIGSEFEPCDIINCDETGLYDRAFPDHTLMLAYRATGEKLKLPVTLLHNEKTWMNSKFSPTG